MPRSVGTRWRSTRRSSPCIHEPGGALVGDRRDRNAFEDLELQEDLLQSLVLWREALLAADRAHAALHDVQVLGRRAEIPPPAPVAVRVGPRPQPEIRLLPPIPQVVTALEPGEPETCGMGSIFEFTNNRYPFVPRHDPRSNTCGSTAPRSLNASGEDGLSDVGRFQPMRIELVIDRAET
jgi:hypothetical protein